MADDPKVFVPLKGMVEKGGLTNRFLKREMSEYEALNAEIDALRAEVTFEHPIKRK